MSDLEMIGNFHIFPNEIIRIILNNFSIYELIYLTFCSKYWKNYIFNMSFLKNWFSHNEIELGECFPKKFNSLGFIYFKSIKIRIFGGISKMIPNNRDTFSTSSISIQDLKYFRGSIGLENIPIYYKKRKCFTYDSYSFEFDEPKKTEIDQHIRLKFSGRGVNFQVLFYINTFQFENSLDFLGRFRNLSKIYYDKVNIWEDFYILVNNRNVLKWYNISKIIPSNYHK